MPSTLVYRKNNEVKVYSNFNDLNQQVFSISNQDDQYKQWIYKKDYKKSETMSLSCMKELLSVVDSVKKGKRSTFIEDCYVLYLNHLEKTFDEPIPIFNRRSEFFRNAIIYGLSKLKKKGAKQSIKKHKADFITIDGKEFKTRRLE